MGLSLSTDSLRITELGYKIKEQEEQIQNLQIELNSLRSIHDAKLLSKDVMDKIGETWNTKNYEYLVLSGGGIKGFGLVGAIEILEQLGITPKLKGIAGTSVGSIVAALLAIGYTSKEIIQIIIDMDVASIFDDKPGYICDAVNFVKDWGVCPGNRIMSIMSDLVHKKTADPNYTLSDLKRDKGITLVIVATDVNSEKSVYFHPFNSIKAYSDISIVTAVRISCGIPLCFEPFEYNNRYFVDGGVLDNFPLHVFDGTYPGDMSAKLNLCKPNHKVLGIKLVSAYDHNHSSTTFSNVFEYLGSFINMFLIENEKHQTVPGFWLRTIMINTPTYPITKFSLSKKEKQELIDLGRQQTSKFFANK